MRRNRRGMYDSDDSYKSILLVAGGILLVAIVSFFVVYGIYNNKIEKTGLADIEQNNSKINIPDSATNTATVSSSIGKNIVDSQNISEDNNSITLTTEGGSSNKISKEENKVVAVENPKTSSQSTDNQSTNKVSSETSNKTTAEEKEPSFIAPVEDGEIIREFAKDNLVYSDTLQEWITHLGIDIKVPKTTVVKATEAGEVESIKNDPRYGLTVIIKHPKDYKTIYSNLLTSEFVNVGDKVEKGKTIGTVGNSASFEVADEPHLHFEIVKSDEKVDPTLYIK